MHPPVHWLYLTILITKGDETVAMSCTVAGVPKLLFYVAVDVGDRLLAADTLNATAARMLGLHESSIVDSGLEAAGGSTHAFVTIATQGRDTIDQQMQAIGNKLNSEKFSGGCDLPIVLVRYCGHADMDTGGVVGRLWRMIHVKLQGCQSMPDPADRPWSPGAYIVGLGLE